MSRNTVKSLRHHKVVSLSECAGLERRPVAGVQQIRDNDELMLPAFDGEDGTFYVARTITAGKRGGGTVEARH